MNTEELIEAVAALEYPHYSKSKFSSTESFNHALADYRNAERLLRMQWRNWLRSEYAYEFYDQGAGLIFDKAWEEGHSEGYKRVENLYEEFAQFVVDVNKWAIV